MDALSRSKMDSASDEREQSEGMENNVESGFSAASGEVPRSKVKGEDTEGGGEAGGSEQVVAVPGSGDSCAEEDGAAVAKVIVENGANDTSSVPDASAVKENDVRDECLSEHGVLGGHAENGKEEDNKTMDILGNGLLVKTILMQGAGRGSRPISGDKVTLRVEGRLEDGTVVDKDEALTFVLNDGDVIHAFDLAVPLMEMGEECELKTAAKYAYGEIGREPDVPPDTDITYSLTLLQREDGPVYMKLSVQEKLELGESKRERGNYLFARKDFTGAINSYTKALRIVESPGLTPTEESLQQITDCQLKCYNNLAACQLKGMFYEAAIRNCNEVLKIQPDNVKALYRMGKAYASRGDPRQATVFLKRALKHDPSSMIAQKELYVQTKKMQKEASSEKEMYQRMMGTRKSPPKKPSYFWKKPLMVGAAVAVLMSMGAAAYRYSAH